MKETKSGERKRQKCRKEERDKEKLRVTEGA
jgi:hypothetical protein